MFEKILKKIMTGQNLKQPAKIERDALYLINECCNDNTIINCLFFLIKKNIDNEIDTQNPGYLSSLIFKIFDQKIKQVVATNFSNDFYTRLVNTLQKTQINPYKNHALGFISKMGLLYTFDSQNYEKKLLDIIENKHKKLKTIHSDFMEPIGTSPLALYSSTTPITTGEISLDSSSRSHTPETQLDLLRAISSKESDNKFNINLCAAGNF